MTQDTQPWDIIMAQKLYAVVRNDLNMPSGKMAAQAGHAFLEAFLASPPQLAEHYRTDSVGTKIVLQASLYEIEDIKRRLDDEGLPNVLIEDSGHILPPHFDGSPIVTALGVGLSPRAPKLVSHLKLQE